MMMMEDYSKSEEFQRWLAMWGAIYVRRYNLRKRDEWLTTWGKVYAERWFIENEWRRGRARDGGQPSPMRRNPYALNKNEQEFSHRMADAGTPTARNVYGGHVPSYDKAEAERRARRWLRQWRRFNETDDGYESM